MKIIKNVYELKQGFIYTKPDDCWNFEKSFLINGLEPIKTFKDGYYYSDKKIKKIEEKKTIKINERWELKNKELYNEKIPMIIDNSTREVFDSLIENNLYDYTYEEKNVIENIDFKILNYQKIDVTNRFNDYTIRREYSSWNGWQDHAKYIINDLLYTLEDNCLIPSPIKELTRPCVLPGSRLYEIIRDFIKRNIDKNVSDITSDYDFTFTVKDIRTKMTIFIMNNDNGRNNDYKLYNFDDIISENYDELLNKINKIKKIIIEHINYKEKVELKGFIYIKEMLVPSKIDLIDANLVEKVEE